MMGVNAGSTNQPTILSVNMAGDQTGSEHSQIKTKDVVRRWFTANKPEVKLKQGEFDFILIGEWSVFNDELTRQFSSCTFYCIRVKDKPALAC